jgi:hypothetical protein
MVPGFPTNIRLCCEDLKHSSLFTRSVGNKERSLITLTPSSCQGIKKCISYIISFLASSSFNFLRRLALDAQG